MAFWDSIKAAYRHYKEVKEYCIEDSTREERIRTAQQELVANEAKYAKEISGSRTELEHVKNSYQKQAQIVKTCTKLQKQYIESPIKVELPFLQRAAQYWAVRFNGKKRTPEERTKLQEDMDALQGQSEQAVEYCKNKNKDFRDAYAEDAMLKKHPALQDAAEKDYVAAKKIASLSETKKTSKQSASSDSVDNELEALKQERLDLQNLRKEYMEELESLRADAKKSKAEADEFKEKHKKAVEDLPNVKEAAAAKQREQEAKQRAEQAAKHQAEQDRIKAEQAAKQKAEQDKIKAAQEAKRKAEEARKAKEAEEKNDPAKIAKQAALEAQNDKTKTMIEEKEKNLSFMKNYLKSREDVPRPDPKEIKALQAEVKEASEILEGHKAAFKAELGDQSTEKLIGDDAIYGAERERIANDRAQRAKDKEVLDEREQILTTVGPEVVQDPKNVELRAALDEKARLHQIQEKYYKSQASVPNPDPKKISEMRAGLDQGKEILDARYEALDAEIKDQIKERVRGDNLSAEEKERIADNRAKREIAEKELDVKEERLTGATPPPSPEQELANKKIRDDLAQQQRVINNQEKYYKSSTEKPNEKPENLRQMRSDIDQVQEILNARFAAFDAELEDQATERRLGKNILPEEKEKIAENRANRAKEEEELGKRDRELKGIDQPSPEETEQRLKKQQEELDAKNIEIRMELDEKARLHQHKEDIYKVQASAPNADPKNLSEMRAGLDQVKEILDARYEAFAAELEDQVKERVLGADMTKEEKAGIAENRASRAKAEKELDREEILHTTLVPPPTPEQEAANKIISDDLAQRDKTHNNLERYYQSYAKRPNVKPEEVQKMRKELDQAKEILDARKGNFAEELKDQSVERLLKEGAHDKLDPKFEKERISNNRTERAKELTELDQKADAIGKEPIEANKDKQKDTAQAENPHRRKITPDELVGNTTKDVRINGSKKVEPQQNQHTRRK
ncbi:MAG: hypothetical protein R3Y07_00010 [Eubacteriales bacterium]